MMYAPENRPDPRTESAQHVECWCDRCYYHWCRLPPYTLNVDVWHGKNAMWLTAIFDTVGLATERASGLWEAECRFQRRKPWGTWGTRPPPRIWSGGTPMYNVSPDFNIFSVCFPYLERQRKILYIVFISLTSNCHCAALTTR